MRVLFVVGMFTVCTALGGALGLAENSQERVKKTWTLDDVRSLDVHGQVEFTLVPGSTPTITVETTKALFDQLTVSNWWGAATVAIDTGLEGPREPGAVTIWISLPSLRELKVSGESSGTVTWPGPSGSIRIDDRSQVQVLAEGTALRVQAAWHSKAVLKGHVDALEVVARQESEVDASQFSDVDTLVDLNYGSVYRSGATTKGTGKANHDSRVVTRSQEAWSSLVVQENSVREVRTESPSP